MLSVHIISYLYTFPCILKQIAYLYFILKKNVKLTKDMREDQNRFHKRGLC